MENNQQFGFNNQDIEPCPDNNLVWAILCTVLCCMPLGVVAIIKSTSVEKLWHQGRYEEAIKASKSALTFSIIGAVLQAIGVIVYILFIVILTILGY